MGVLTPTDAPERALPLLWRGSLWRRDIDDGREQRAVFADDVMNGDEAVRLAAAEAGARQYDEIAAIAEYALERVDQQRANAVGEA